MIREDVTAIIFDFGGIFINLDYTATISAFQQLGIVNFDVLYSQAQQSNLFDNYETGKISSQRFINGLLDFLPANTTPNQVVGAWNAMLLDIESEKVKLLLDLRKTYPVYLLSNTNKIHIDLAFRRWKKTIGQPIHDYFDKIYLSHEVGLRKPNKEIFDLVCTENDLNPSHTLFIDDTEQHINGAKSIGLQTHQHVSNAPLHPIFS
ncbi:MAG: HAD family phosphatase [Crocinitomicaceae bacterium]|jgi:HAD superfamily hydrolase (TIGR01509 family)